MSRTPEPGRGAGSNPLNRFERLEYVRDDDSADDGQSRTRTIFLRDPSRTIITRNDSPDVGFETSINPYRGCEHEGVFADQIRTLFETSRRKVGLAASGPELSIADFRRPVTDQFRLF